MVPSDRKYAESHEWAKKDGEVVMVGITAFAVEHLSDLTFLSLPEVGEELEAGDRFGEIESVKAVSELFAPVGGKVIEVNEPLADDVDAVGSDPFGDGWMLKLQVDGSESLDGLMDAEAYERHIAEESD